MVKMNRVVNRKSVLKNYISGSTEKRQKKKEKCTCPAITRKGKNVRKSIEKVKKMVRNVNFLNEWAENESSKPELYEDPKILRNLHRVQSDDSVIFVGNCIENQLHSATPIIDLTHSSTENLHENINLFRSKTLKTIYFPSRNFDRNIKLRKSMATTSLVTLPVIQKQKLPRKLNSTTVLSCADQKKLAILDVPQEYLNSPDVNVDSVSFYEKSQLTKKDYKMIDWILDVENNVEFSLSPSTSGYNSSLEADISKEKIDSIHNIHSHKRLNGNT